jgi:alanyl-tRNA synthetase
MRNHSATHLLHKALRDLLGSQVQQRGSLVEPERLRFDFTSPRALNGSDLEQIDTQINQWIRSDYPVHTNIMPIEEAMQTGAMALFGEKYDNVVRVVSMGKSIELCGGTHCATTGQIGTYVTVQETSVAAGIRRIEALTGRAAETYLRHHRQTVDRLATTLQVQTEQVESRVEQLLQELTTARRQITQYQRNEIQLQSQHLVRNVQEVAGTPLVTASVQVPDAKLLRDMGEQIRAQLKQPGVVVLASDLGERIAIQVTIDPSLTKHGLHAGKLAGIIGERLGGKGGGRPDSAQGGGKDKTAIDPALDLAKAFVRDNLK